MVGKMLHHSTLDIHSRDNQGIVILDLRGKLEMGNGDIALREFVESQLGQGDRQLVLNMAHVSDIDTAGMGVLLLLAQQSRDAGGRMVLFKLDRVHAKIYEMARLETVVEIYSDEIDAVNSFFPDRVVAHYDILEYVEEHVHENDQKK
jgi:anti-sigma B factor antagonist